MYEDRLLEAEVLPERGRIFCIASAGCTAFALASRGASVTAVDANPAQIEYVQARLDGAEPRMGSVERRLARLRTLGRLAGWTPAALSEFCGLADGQAQVNFWREHLDTRRFRAGLALLLNPVALRLAFSSPLVAAVPPRFGRVVRRRLERGFARHPNRDNPYARFLLLGDVEQPAPRPGLDLALACADAAAFLEQSAPSRFDGFSLSNVLDGTSPAYGRRLRAAVRRAAAPGAVAILRSFDEPASAEEVDWAARDRSLLWGSVRVEQADA
jgi:S-adenosylmethionine:diacylglycerol 3-amino-3-carboxypropyl transferase